MPTEYQQPRIVHQACCRAHHRSDPTCSAVTYIYHTLLVPVVPCWQPSTALTNPHTTAPHFAVLFSSIFACERAVHSLVVSCYIFAAASPRAAVYLVGGRILTNAGDLRRCWGCSGSSTGPNSKSTGRSQPWGSSRLCGNSRYYN